MERFHALQLIKNKREWVCWTCQKAIFISRCGTKHSNNFYSIFLNYLGSAHRGSRVLYCVEYTRGFIHSYVLQLICTYVCSICRLPIGHCISDNSIVNISKTILYSGVLFMKSVTTSIFFRIYRIFLHKRSPLR